MSRLLLLEDGLSLIDGLAYSLKKQGHETAVARTVKETCALFAENAYDLLLLDLSLPDGTGFDFCKTVRATSKVPITFLTASDEEVNMIMGLDIDGDDYITKPFKLGVLVSHINSCFVSAIVKSTWIFVKSTRPPLRISDIIFTEDK